MKKPVCRNCKWYKNAAIGYIDFHDFHECHHPSRVYDTKDFVTGHVTTHVGSCDHYNEYGQCKKFEKAPKKPPFSQQLKRWLKMRQQAWSKEDKK